MKTIIAGSRSILSMDHVIRAIEIAKFPITEVVCGMAQGPDILGMIWAAKHNIPVKKFPANWDKLGKSAGYKRNQQMAEYADACIVVWDGISKGSMHMIDLAKKHKIKLCVYTP